MNLPVLPQSNLYRFKSIVGLVFISLSMILNFYLLVDYNQQSIRINSVVGLLKTDIENASMELDIIRNKVLPLCKLNNCRCADEKGVLIEPVFEKGPPLITKKQQEINALFLSYAQIDSKMKRTELRVKQKENLLENYTMYIYPYFISLLLVLVLGLFFFIRGISDWKNKIQRYQDILLRKYAKNYQPDT